MNDIDGLWQLPVMCSTTLGAADAPTVSSSGRGDQPYRVAQSAELSEARTARPSRAASERRGCGNPRHGKRVKRTNTRKHALYAYTETDTDRQRDEILAPRSQAAGEAV